MKMLARKGGVAAILKTLRRTSNNGISLAPFTSASNNDFKIRSWSEDVKEGGNRTVREEIIRSSDETADGTPHDRTSSVAESLKEGAVKAMETGLNVGEKAKQSMDDVFDAAKETTKNVKDAVVDDANDAMRKGYDYPHTDSHTESLRKRAAGYDVRDGN